MPRSATARLIPTETRAKVGDMVPTIDALPATQGIPPIQSCGVQRPPATDNAAAETCATDQPCCSDSLRPRVVFRAFMM